MTGNPDAVTDQYMMSDRVYLHRQSRVMLYSAQGSADPAALQWCLTHHGFRQQNWRNVTGR